MRLSGLWLPGRVHLSPQDKLSLWTREGKHLFIELKNGCSKGTPPWGSPAELPAPRATHPGASRTDASRQISHPQPPTIHPCLPPSSVKGTSMTPQARRNPRQETECHPGPALHIGPLPRLAPSATYVPLLWAGSLHPVEQTGHRPNQSYLLALGP